MIRSQDLKNQGKNHFIENREEDFKLSEYNIALEEHIFWQYQYQIASLMENFLNRKINGKKFCDRVFGFRRKLMNRYDKFLLELSLEKVKDFQSDERSKKLSGFLTYLFCYCDDFMGDYENDEFSTTIQNSFLNFQNFIFYIIFIRIKFIFPFSKLFQFFSLSENILSKSTSLILNPPQIHFIL